MSIQTHKPLVGIRILDFTTAVAGPIATMILADMGAEVIKIEAPNSRHVARGGDRPPVEGAPDHPWNRMATFNELNRSKRSLVLDVARPEGRRLFLRLAAKCDIMFENFSPRVLTNLGIDYPDLVKERSDIILVSMPAFGKSGPYRERISYGPGVDAMSGLSHLTGYPDRGPSKPGFAYCDQNAGLMAAYVALAALRLRRRTGEGQQIEVAMIEGEMQLVGEALIDYAMNGRVQSRIGNRHPTMTPHGVYPCSGDDCWVAIACRNDRDFAAMCMAMGQPHLAADARFANLVTRKQNEDALDEIITDWTRTLDHYCVQQQLQAVGVPAGAALDVVELFEDPHMRARGLFEMTSHPEMGPSAHNRVAWKLSRTPAPVTVPAPLFGQDNDFVLRELLGLSTDEIAGIRTMGIVAEAPTGRH
ncbi:MAG: CaiB/BaiF CoA transferase family protein [Dehalococcoidia bacterium]